MAAERYFDLKPLSDAQRQNAARLAHDIEILRLGRDGVSDKKIARRVGLHRTTVNGIVRAQIALAQTRQQNALAAPGPGRDEEAEALMLIERHGRAGASLAAC